MQQGTGNGAEFDDRDGRESELNHHTRFQGDQGGFADAPVRAARTQPSDQEALTFPLVRTEERRRVFAALRESHSGAAQVIELSGDPGSGKTRLLKDVSQEAARRGLRVLSGQCSATGRDMVVELFARAFEADPGRPAVVLLDDVQWADQSSVEHIENLLRWPRDCAPLVILAHRPRQTHARLRGTLAHCAELGTVERIELGALTPCQSAELLGLSVDDECLHELHAEARGNPQYLLALARIGPEAVRSAPLAADPDPFVEFAARARYEFDLLTSVEAVVMQAAIVIAGSFDVNFLAAVAGLDFAATCTGAAGLVGRDLLRQTPGQAGLTLRHALVGEALLQGIPLSWRRSAHRRAADLLARRRAPAVEQAVHIELGGPARADDVRTLIRAAEDSMGANPHDAVRWCRTGLRELTDNEPGGHRRRDLMLLLARALSGLGRLQESRGLLYEVLQLATDPGRVRADAISRCAAIEHLIGKHAEAGALFAAELDKIDRYSPPDAAHLLIEAGLHALGGSSGPEPGQIDSALRAAARCPEDRTVQTGAAVLSALHQALTGRYSEADRSIAACAPAIDAMTDAVLADRLIYLSALAWAQMYTGRHVGAERRLRRGIAVARKSGDFVVIAEFLNSLFYLSFQFGPFEPTPLESGCSRVRGGRDDDIRSVSLAWQAMHAVWTETADNTLAMRLAEQSYAGTSSTPCCRSAQTVALACAAAFDCDAERCVSLLVTGCGGPDLPALPEIVRPMCFELLTYTTATAGHPTAADWAARTEEAARAIPLPHQHAHAVVASAHIARMRGEHRAAAEEYTRAADLFAGAGMVRARARALALSGSCLAELGEYSRADSAYRLAEGLGLDCGATRLSRAAHQMRLRFADVQAARQVDADVSPHLAALTHRERQVAAAASTGKRTREIAEELHLSPRTVDVHLTHIYRKLDLRSRAALAKLIAEVDKVLPTTHALPVISGCPVPPCFALIG